MSPRHHFCRARVILSCAGPQKSIRPQFCRAAAIMLLIFDHLCAGQYTLPARGAAPVNLLSFSRRDEPAVKTSAARGVSIEAMQNLQPVLKNYTAPVVQSGTKTVEIAGTSRQLQFDVKAASTSQRPAAVHDASSRGPLQLTRHAQPAMDVSFLFTPSPAYNNVSSFAAHVLEPSPANLFAVIPLNGSQALSPAEGGFQRRGVYLFSPDGRDLHLGHGFSGRSGPASLELYASARQSFPEKETQREVLLAESDDRRSTKNAAKLPTAELSTPARTPMDSKNRLLVPPQLHTGEFDGKSPAPSQLNAGYYMMRQRNPGTPALESVVSSTKAAGAKHSAGRSEGSSVVDWTSAPALLSGVAKTETSSKSLSPSQNIARVAESPFGLWSRHSASDLPVDATKGILLTLLGPLLPIVGPFLGSNILAGHLLNLKTAAEGLSATKEIVPFLFTSPSSYAPSSLGRLPASTTSHIFSAPLGSQPFPAPNQVVGILSLLSQVLRRLARPQVVSNAALERRDPPEQIGRLRAPADQGAHPVSGRPNTPTIFPPTIAVGRTGVSSQSSPSSFAHIDFAASDENAPAYTLNHLSAIKLTPPFGREDDTFLSSGSASAERDAELLTPESVLRPALPMPTGAGNTTATTFPSRPTRFNPLNALPTDHFRPTGDLDSDMASFLNDLVQRVWRTSQGPSSFMKPPQPLYSHRSPEGATEDVASVAEAESQDLQPEAQQPNKHTSTSFSEAEDDLGTNFNERGSEALDQDEFSRGQQAIASRKHDGPPGTLFAAAGGPFLSELSNAMLFPASHEEEKAGRGFDALQETKTTKTQTPKSEFLTKRAQSTVFSASKLMSGDVSGGEDAYSKGYKQLWPPYPYDEAADDRSWVPPRTNEWRSRQDLLAATDVGDEVQQEVGINNFDLEETEQRNIVTGVAAAPQHATYGSVPDKLERTIFALADVPETSTHTFNMTGSRFQLLYAGQPLHPPQGEGDCRGVCTSRQQGRGPLYANSSGVPAQELSFQRSGSLPNLETLEDYTNGASLPRSPKDSMFSVRREQEKSEKTSSMEKRGAKEGELQERSFPIRNKTPFILLREPAGNEEAWQPTPERTATGEATLLGEETRVTSALAFPRTEGLQPFFESQPKSASDRLTREEFEENARTWQWESTEEDFNAAFDGFPTPYDYYFPLDTTDEVHDQLQQSHNRAAPEPVEGPGADGISHNGEGEESRLPLFISDNALPTKDASEGNENTKWQVPSPDFVFYRNSDLPDKDSLAPFGDEQGPVFGGSPLYSTNEDVSIPPLKDSDAFPSEKGVPLFSKLSSFFQTSPLLHWLRLDPTQVGPFDWKTVFGELIPVGSRLKRAKHLAHGVILNEYCNPTALESVARNTSMTLSGFTFNLELFHVPKPIQSDFEKCVEYYRTRTREYVEEYRLQCQDIWEDPEASNGLRTHLLTVDDIADCFVKKYDVGRRWFNELFYQPWYRLVNQTSYLLQAVDTAFTEFQYDAWFFPAAYSAANFGLWRTCLRVEDCFTGERCVDALPKIYNFTLSFCHPTPESMNLDPITNMTLADKFYAGEGNPSQARALLVATQ